MYTLVVVDMQPDFNAANNERVRENCLREIIEAVKNNSSIIFLEFDGYDPTLPELMTPVQGLYSNYYIKGKDSDDGSLEVKELVKQYNLPLHFRVCGVNTDCCVKATVKGLTKKFPRSFIQVIVDACNSDWYHDRGLEVMRGLKNVFLKHKEENNV